MTRSFFGRDAAEIDEPASRDDFGPEASDSSGDFAHLSDAVLDVASDLRKQGAGARGPATPSSDLPSPTPPESPTHAGGFWLKAPGFRGRRSRAFREADGHEGPPLASTLADLTRRLQALEDRPTAAAEPNGGLAATLRARLDGVERDLATVAAIVGEALSSPAAGEGPARPGGSTGEERQRLQAIDALEEAIGRVAAQMRERDARAEAQALQAREGFRAMSVRLDRMEARGRPDRSPELSSVNAALARLAARLDRVESAPEPVADAVDAALSPLMRRIEETQRRTLDSLQGLEGSLTGLERLVGRMASAEPATRTGADPGPASVRAPRTSTPEAGPEDTTFRQADDALDHVEAALRDLSDQVTAIDHRSAAAISQMGHEVIRLAQSLDGRVDDVERRSGERAAEMGSEMARLAHVVEDRLTRADDARAEALERLGARIASVALQLADRIASSERRSAQNVAAGLQAATEQLHRATHTLNTSRERTARELAEQMRSSEERAARLLVEARGRSGAAPAPVSGELSPSEPEAVRAGPAPSPSALAAPGPGLDRRSASPAETPGPDEVTKAAMEAIAASVGAFHTLDGVRREPPAPAEARPGPAPASKPTNRDIIEAARAAARMSAEVGQRPQSRLGGASGQAPDGSEVLTLRSRFALPLRRRRDG